MKQLFQYLVPIIGFMQPFFWPVVTTNQWVYDALGFPKKELYGLLWGFAPLLLFLLPLPTLFGVTGTIFGSYMILYAVFRVLFTVSYWSYKKIS